MRNLSALSASQRFSCRVFLHRPGDTVVVGFRNQEPVDSDEKLHLLLGFLRLEVARQLRETGELCGESTDPHFLWVTDFPLLEQNVRCIKTLWQEFDHLVWFSLSDGPQEQGQWCAVHHPFTAPAETDLAGLHSGDYHGIKARSYDLVCNGMEVRPQCSFLHRLLPR